MRRFLTALAVLGVVFVAYGMVGRGGPPSPSDAAETWSGADVVGRPLPASQPVQLEIPSIDVRARVVPSGVDDQGAIEPPPRQKPWVVSWYRRSVTPGESGAAVLLGHVDSRRSGPAVFYELGVLRPGERIEVQRRDDTTAVFRVRRVRSYPRDEFPTGTVFGTESVEDDRPVLRLITCGGAYEADAGYQRNVVAFAVMVDAESAGLF